MANANLDTPAAGPEPVPPRPAKKRRRPALACEQCRLRKVRCDRNLPCGTCIRSGSAECTYVPNPLANLVSRASREVPSSTTPAEKDPVSDAASVRNGSLLLYRSEQRESSASSVVSAGPVSTRTSAPTPRSRTSSAGTIDSLEKRLRTLEKELQLALGRKNGEPSSTGKGLEFDSLRNGKLKSCILDLNGPPGSELGTPTFSQVSAGTIRGTVSKTRFFGPSHWVNGADMFPIFIDLIHRAAYDKATDLYCGLQKCKSLARIIKARRIPTVTSLAIGQAVPSRSVADALINAYLRTYESIYRVVHIPSFRAEYERYWEHPLAANTAFVILMQLCMAIGACFYDDTFSLRTEATRWIYEAMLWLILPPEKSRLTIPGLQIMCLLHFAKQVVGVGADLTWIGSGSLLRSAMYMGLHHDPENLVKMPLFRAEMRRRLWATILEICLQSSLDAGGPPMLKLSDFDTKPPANLDEMQLAEEGNDADARVLPKARDYYTQTSLQIALLESFPERLATVTLLNGTDRGVTPLYDETLRLSAELTKASRALIGLLQNLPGDENAVEGVSFFQRHLVELTMNRFVLSLHLSFLPSAFGTPNHYFSRKMSVDTSVKIARLFKLVASNTTAGNTGLRDQSTTDFVRLLVGAAGPSRTAPIQAGFVVGLELTTLREEERKSLGVDVALGGAELRAILDASMVWTAARIRAGETNIKGHAFSKAITSHIDAIEAGLGEEEKKAKIMEDTSECVAHCYQMLCELAGDLAGQPDLEGRGEATGATAGADMMDDVLGDWEWDEMMLGPGGNSNIGLDGMDMFFPLGK